MRNQLEMAGYTKVHANYLNSSGINYKEAWFKPSSDIYRYSRNDEWFIKAGENKPDTDPIPGTIIEIIIDDDLTPAPKTTSFGNRIIDYPTRTHFFTYGCQAKLNADDHVISYELDTDIVPLIDRFDVESAVLRMQEVEKFVMGSLRGVLVYDRTTVERSTDEALLNEFLRRRERGDDCE